MGLSRASAPAPPAPPTTSATPPQPPTAATASAPTGAHRPAVHGADATLHFVQRSIDGTWGRLQDVLGHAGRHAANNIGAVGIPGMTWNVREAYRTRYNADQRMGAALGDAVTIGVAAMLLGAWQRKQFAVPAILGLPPTAIRVVAIGALGMGVANSIVRTVQNTRDDGNLGMLGASIAVMGSVLLTRNVPGKVQGKVAMIGAAAIAGIAGHWLGSQVRLGAGHLGQAAPRPDSEKLPGHPLLAGLRGTFNHFVEAGPISQGTSFGKSWHQTQAMQERYTDGELAGGMVGDVIAGAFVGTSALVVGARVLGRPEADRLRRSTLSRLSMELSVPGRIIGKLKDVGSLATVEANAIPDIIARTADSATQLRWAQRTQEDLLRKVKDRVINFKGKRPDLLYAFGAGIFALTLWDAYYAGSDKKNSNIGGPAAAALAAAGMITGAALVSRYAPIVKDLPASVRPGMSLVTAAAVVAAVQMLREPIGSFVDGARFLHQRRNGVQLNAASVGMVGLGGVAGGLLGVRGAELLAYQGPLRVAAISAGAIVGGLIGFGFAPLLAPGTKGRHLGDLPE